MENTTTYEFATTKREEEIKNYGGLSGMFDTSLPVTNIDRPNKASMFWETNYNNKLTNTAFIHLDLAPSKKPLRSVIDSTLYEIFTVDNSFPGGQYILYDMVFMSLAQIVDWLTFASHGVDALTFVESVFQKHKKRIKPITWKTEMCIYFYKKI